MTEAAEAPEAAGAPHVHRVQEGVTMALYISLSLMAVMLALPRNVEALAQHPAVLVGITAIGLIVAHLVAFSMSSRLVSEGKVTAHARDLIGAQLLGGLAVTGLAVIPLLVFEGYNAIVASELVLLGLIATVGYRVARVAQLSRFRALLYVGGVVVVALAVLWLKSLGDH
jgi:hypothetical protein